MVARMNSDHKITQVSDRFEDLSVQEEFVPGLNVGAVEFVPSFDSRSAAAPDPNLNSVVDEVPIENDGKSESDDVIESRAPENALHDAQSLLVDNGNVNNETHDTSDDRKENISVVFIGHVDAGKSTLGGQILNLSGAVDKRTIAKYEKEAKDSGKETWYLSWVLDLYQEERSKGKTTEYGRGFFETNKRRFTILDAPGHKSFVPSMIEGASQADVAILVVSARKGEFETGFDRGGQTREHVILAKAVGVKHLILVLNKMDDPTVEWSEERYNSCTSRLVPFAKKVGFDAKCIESIPLSAYCGTNVLEKVNSDVCSWYSGPSLFEMLDSLHIPDRGYNSPLILPITDKYRDGGLFVAGKIEYGKLRKSQILIVYPPKLEVEVVSIFIEGDPSETAFSGETVKLRLKTTDEDNILPGYVLSVPEVNLVSTTTFVAQVAILEYKSIICETFTSIIHIHAASSESKISKLLYLLDKKTRKKIKSNPRYLKKGDIGIIVIELPHIMCLSTYEQLPQLGRFTLRDEGTTIAAGKILKFPKVASQTSNC